MRPSPPKIDQSEREQRILDAAADLIIRHGYDKTSMEDVAAQVGVSRGVIYLHFASKERLFEALVQREVLKYSHTWLEYVEADPRGGTVGSTVRAVRHALNQHPFMAAIVKQDGRVFGNYLRKPNNLFATMQPTSVRVEFLRAMQEAGAIRKDVKPAVVTHILDIISYGLLRTDERLNLEGAPALDDLLEEMAVMIDCYLTPAGGGDRQAGMAVIRQLAATARTEYVKAPERQE